MSLPETLTHAEVRMILRLAEALDRSTLSFLQIEAGGFTVCFAKDAAGQVAVQSSNAPGFNVRAPAVGIYRINANGAPAVGAIVETATALGQIETMDEVTVVAAGAVGVIVEFCVSDGDFVEHGQALVKIRPHAPALGQEENR
jgi:biotin carboxyl carrier protein